MLKIAYSGLLNAQIARTVIWIRSWEFYFSSAAAAWLRSRRALHGVLAGRRIAGDSFGTLTGRRRGRLLSGAGAIPPAACAGAADAGGACAVLMNSSPLMMRLLQGWSERSTDAPSKPTMSP